MIIGLLDPALFIERAGVDLTCDLDLVLEACKKNKILLIPFKEYWNDLWGQVVRPLQKNAAPALAAAIRELQKLGMAAGKIPVASLQDTPGNFWRGGFDQLFKNVDPEWTVKIAGAALRAVSAAPNIRVVLFTPKIHMRNVLLRASDQGSKLEEVTRWVLHIQSRHYGRHQILCVHHPRNILLPWTARYDWRLATVEDKARYPFCPADRWWNADVEVARTIDSKPCWRDKHGNGWASPNTGGDFHWDVYLHNPQVVQAGGLRQLNIVMYGSTEGTPGDIHHVPGKKAHVSIVQPWKC